MIEVFPQKRVEAFAMECQQLSLDVRWDVVATKSGTPYQFPQAQRVLSEERYAVPVVYRWFVAKAGTKPHACYIGETDNLHRRVGNYLHAHVSQGQVFRVAQRLREEVSSGSVVELQVLQFETFFINGNYVEPSGLSNPARRKLMENIAIMLHDATQCELLNEDMSRMGRRIKRARQSHHF
jgi:hypothetical protein